MEKLPIKQETTQGLAKSVKSSWPVVKICSDEELLTTIPIIKRIKNNEKEYCEILIGISVEKCMLSLGMTINKAQVDVLTEDLLEKYLYDSLEDIIEALKKGRKGNYGFGMNKRASLNMQILTEWMGKHLEEKATAREKILSIEKKKMLDVEAQPIISENHQFYIDQIKGIIKEVSEKSKTAPVITKQNTKDFWITRLQKDRGHRLIYRLITNKIDLGCKLSENEIKWLEAWGISVNQKI